MEIKIINQNNYLFNLICSASDGHTFKNVLKPSEIINNNNNNKKN